MNAKVTPRLYSNTELNLEVSVIDYGIGMSKEEADHVFEPFSRSPNIQSRKLNPSSNGVGLSICKKICQSLEGDIAVKA